MSITGALPPEVEASYATIIDSILAASDINTISAKQIRKGLQQAVTYDLTPQKDLIKELIIARFDKFHSAASAAGDADTEPSHQNGATVREPGEAAVDGGMNGDDHTPSDSYALPDAPSSKKKRKPNSFDEDARLAAKLQALENNKARPTRAGVSKKPPPAKKRKTTKSKPKSNSKVNANEDSDMDSEDGGGPKRKVNRNGGFHKPLNLSAPLSQLLGETALSRPEVVKQIWAYVRENGLQSATDKRFIECDDALRTVFKQERVHMFTMNKLLSQHLFAPDE